MGIPGLWDIIGKGEVTPIAKLAADHLERTKRPLRIAVDEAGWRFSNLTESQVRFIQSKEPRANPIEKAICHRILKLLRLNIQLLFVFDGPHRPHKRGKTAGRIDYEKIELLRKLLDVFKIPHHRAPAEAEAECARLQQLGVVDAVWSEDGDTLMFGCGLLIRDHRINGKKSDTDVQVYRSEVLTAKYGLDRNGLVVFAVLSGGDYDVKGLPGCGPQLAIKAIQSGLGRRLSECDRTNISWWKRELLSFLADNALIIPADFPRDSVVEKYRNPRVSTTHDLENLRGLRRGWDVPIDQERLQECLCKWFNFQIREFVKHICPVLLSKKLADLSAEDSKTNDLKIQLVQPKRAKSKQTSPLRKIKYCPLATISITLAMPIQDGILSYDEWMVSECEVLECLLRRVLPDSSFNAEEVSKAVKSKSKRTLSEDGDATCKATSTSNKRTKGKSRQTAHLNGSHQVESPDWPLEGLLDDQEAMPKFDLATIALDASQENNDQVGLDSQSLYKKIVCTGARSSPHTPLSLSERSHNARESHARHESRQVEVVDLTDL